MNGPLFAALLKFWRGRHGRSQLDLAMTAGVSARHISFLESGRAMPSAAMVLRLMAALEVPLRHQNEALRAAGFEARFAEPELGAMSTAVGWAIERMLVQQEPFALTVLACDDRVLRTNDAAARLFGRFVHELQRLTEPLDMLALLFDPGRVRPFVVDWEQIARRMLARLRREMLLGGGDARLASLFDRALHDPGVDVPWRRPDLSTPIDGTLEIRLRRGDLAVAFMTMVTVFSAPGSATLDELRIERDFPLDETTRLACEAWTRIPAVASTPQSRTSRVTPSAGTPRRGRFPRPARSAGRSGGARRRPKRPRRSPARARRQADGAMTRVGRADAPSIAGAKVIGARVDHGALGALGTAHRSSTAATRRRE